MKKIIKLIEDAIEAGYQHDGQFVAIDKMKEALAALNQEAENKALIAELVRELAKFMDMVNAFNIESWKFLTEGERAKVLEKIKNRKES